MTRILALCVLTLSAAASAQTKEPAKPAEPGRAAPAGEASPAAPEGLGNRVEREQLKREVLDEVKRTLDKQKDEVKDEVRAQVATQTANRSLEEDFQVHEEKRKLELFEVDGYYRVRPNLFYNFDLRRGVDANAQQIFPRPLRDPSGKTLAGANMRWRLEPTLNVSEDIRIHAQADLFDNLVMGSTPEVGDSRVLFAIDSPTQLTPVALKNALLNSVQLKRVYGEVNTPVGQLFFGRMGSHWGLGMLANSGNCLDCDYGDTVDRFMFVAKVGDFFVVPMVDFLAEGPTSATKGELLGQPFDRDQSDDARAYSIAIARRDTDAEIARKLQAGQRILNYGLYFIYRHQSFEALNQGNAVLDPNSPPVFVPRNANLYIPDAWFKFQTSKLRLEAEVAGVFGSIGNAAFSPSAPVQSLTVTQVGAVVQGDYKFVEPFSVNLEFGFASGDKSPGMGNSPGSGSTTTGTLPGQIEGPQYCLDAANCANGTVDTKITNFRFNRDYRVDLILWRELFNGVTDAIYIKPGLKYDLTEGFSIWANLIYSRAIFAESTPSSHLVNGAVVGDANLGVEIDAGIRYDSGDGFLASFAYGTLFPLSGLNNNLNPTSTVNAQVAQALRAWFIIKY